MNIHPTSSSSGIAGPVRRSARAVGAWVKAHRPLVSWLLWATFVLLCVFWVQRYYQPPAGPIWIGKTLRVTVLALCALVVREWLALRWEIERRPVKQWRNPDDTHDRSA
jgi:hypothetical protein